MTVVTLPYRVPFSGAPCGFARKTAQCGIFGQSSGLPQNRPVAGPCPEIFALRAAAGAPAAAP
ncbi:hypothetical protein, partial [uncultured Desulfovibrio sp.]|uniref:hypothetical protein n=1 Tax=uncultured Desulfovibrio sp. TaxID=167968 RepID=UPI002609FD8F